MAKKIVIIYGPQGCGKTLTAQALAKGFDCDFIVDEWDGRSNLRPGSLAFTTLGPDEMRAPVRGAEIMSFYGASCEALYRLRDS